MFEVMNTRPGTSLYFRADGKVEKRIKAFSEFAENNYTTFEEV